MGGFFGNALQFMGFLKAAPIILILLGILVFTNLDFNPASILPSVGDAGKQLRGSVVRVIDGDTLVVETPEGKETVRMIGIDTPETVRPGVSVECGGPEASAKLKQIAAVGSSVKLVTDPSQDERDRYDRLLAYVFPNVGDTTYQERLLKSGWATVYVYGPEFQKVERFREAEDLASSSGRGVWSACGGDFHSAS